MPDLEHPFEAELTRLQSLGCTPEELEIARRYYSDKERESMDESDFCGPHKSYPIKTQEDVDNAAHLIGHAEDEGAVKACVIGKAKSHGWSLPESWQEDNNKDKERMDTPDILRTMPADTSFYMPILRIDREKREVVVRATAEAKDGFGTIFSYDGSKEAFAKWRGNVREQHDPYKAVGRALQTIPVDEEKAIDLVLRVSRGAQDTWEKVLDGTLSGASVGAKNGKWTKKIIDGQEVPYLERYDLVEVSLVDNPATPGCDIKIVRADGLINQDVLDDEDEPEELPPAATTPEETRTEVPEETRAGARISHVTQDALHGMRDGHFRNARDTMSLCGCDECTGGMARFDPDGDGDIDLLPSLDYDGDGGASGDGSGDGQARALRETIARIIQEEISRQANPLILRLNGIASRFAQVPQVSPTAQSQQDTPDITRRLEGLEQKLSGLDEVRSLLSEVKDLTRIIAEQPQQAQPIVNSAVLRALQPDPQNQPPAQTPAQELIELARSGQLNRNQQIENVVSYLTGGNRR
jgi:phage head maturation protease